MTNFKIQEKTAFVTGTSRSNGIGRALVAELLSRGSAKIYATARRAEQLDDLVAKYSGRVEAVALDVTDRDAIGRLAGRFPDVDLLVNNAGIFTEAGALGDPRAALQEVEVNYVAPLLISQAFGPRLRAAKGALVNLNSIASLVNFPLGATYSASKAASHSLTQAQRRELAPDVLVVGVYPGPIDTDMAEKIPFAKTPPTQVAKAIADALESGLEDVFPDPMAQQMYEGWKNDAKAMERQMAAMAAGEVAAD